MEYQITHRIILDIYNDIKSERIVLAPYYQRNTVWRESHKKDFIKTILLELPFPQIFIAKGNLNVTLLTTTQSVVDGQQRLTSIREFIEDNLKVEQKYFSQYDQETREKFLNYKVPIIFLDIDSDDPQIKDVFARLNRTSQTLSTIEKLSSEFSASEIMLVAKLLTREIDINMNNIDKDSLKYDPFIDSKFYDWAQDKKINSYCSLMLEGFIFSPYQISRQEHLLFTLNIINNILFGITARNIKKETLESYSEEFKAKDEIIEKLENIAKKIKSMNLRKDSYWRNKANMFSLIIALYKNYKDINKIKAHELKNKLEDFYKNLPNNYRIAAKEGVNNKKERVTRNKFLEMLIFDIVSNSTY